jgi:hypothetical protein
MVQRVSPCVVCTRGVTSDRETNKLAEMPMPTVRMHDAMVTDCVTAMASIPLLTMKLVF